jgi:hypothetical protein
MINTLDTSQFDSLIKTLQGCKTSADKLCSDYTGLREEFNIHTEEVEKFDYKVASFEDDQVEKINEDFGKFQELISAYNQRLDEIREEFKASQETEMTIKKLSVNIITCERYLVTLKMKYMTISMQQKHDMKKHMIKETYKTKMKDMKNEISVKTENLKKMLECVDDILENWKQIQKDTEIELDK